MATRLKNLRINEVSSVDRGAGKGVQILLMKRDFSDDERKSLAASGEAMPDGSFPIRNGKDLENAIHAIGRAKDPAKAKTHIKTRARALGMSDKLPETWSKSMKISKTAAILKDLSEATGSAISFDEAHGGIEAQEYAEGMLEEIQEAMQALCTSVRSIMCDDDLSDKQDALEETFSQFKEHVQGIVPEDEEDEITKAAHAAIFGKAKPMTPEEEKKRKEEEAKRAEKDKKMEKRFAELEHENAILKMSSKHKDYMDSADMKDDEKAKFMAKSPAERDDHMKENPVEKRLPESIRKALDQAAADRETVRKLQEKDEISTFAKRATDIGLTEAHGETLRKAHGGDAAAFGEIEKIIKGLTAQVRTGKVFAEFGTAIGKTGTTAYDELIAKRDELRKSLPSLSTAQAFAKVYEDPSNRDLVKAYKAEQKRERAA